MNSQELTLTATELVSEGKGILAADESTRTIKKRLEGVEVEGTEDNRRAYRELLFTTPRMEQYISGVILYDETIRQKTQDGTPFPTLLAQKGVTPGIKVDTGTFPLANFPDEVVTEGLDGLRERLIEYYALGARFAKWRAVISISQSIPTQGAVMANAHALARYAALCQEVGLVPIVEPEVLMDGGHTLARSETVTRATLATVFDQLHDQRVLFEGMLLKPNMVVPGEKSLQQASATEVAEATLRVLRRTVPAAVPGIVFLSGGQSPERATKNLNAMNLPGNHPWALSFSYGRALQAPVLETWRGRGEAVEKAQGQFLKRAELNSAAQRGIYSEQMEIDVTEA